MEESKAEPEKDKQAQPWLASADSTPEERVDATCSMLFISSQSWSSRSTAISSKYTQRLGMPFPLFMLGSPGKWFESSRLRIMLLFYTDN